MPFKAYCVGYQSTMHFLYILYSQLYATQYSI